MSRVSNSRWMSSTLSDRVKCWCWNLKSLMVGVCACWWWDWAADGNIWVSQGLQEAQLPLLGPAFCVYRSVWMCAREATLIPPALNNALYWCYWALLQPLNIDSLHLPHSPTSGKHNLVQNVPELRAGDLGPWSLWILLQVLRADEWPSCRHLRSKSRTTFHHPL